MAFLCSEVTVPEEVLLLQQTASALPPASKLRTSTRRRCRDSVDVLLVDAEAVQPQQAVRTHRYTDILAPVVAPGARHAYRIGQGINLDYGNDSISFLSENMLASIDFLNVLYKCTTICHKCQYTVNFEALGFGPAKSIISKC